jgi:hypothetical protein
VTTTEPATSSDEPAEPAQVPQARRWRLPKALTLTALTAVIALLSGGIGLVFDLRPGLRPDPRTERSSDAKILAVDRYVSRLEYLRRRHLQASAFVQAQARERALAGGQSAGLRIKGELLYVQVALHGFKGDHVMLARSVYDIASKRRIFPARTQSMWSGDAPTDQWIAEVWLEPVVGPHRRFFARIEIRDDDGVLLAMTDSAPFRGLNAEKIAP